MITIGSVYLTSAVEAVKTKIVLHAFQIYFILEKTSMMTLMWTRGVDCREWCREFSTRCFNT